MIVYRKATLNDVEFINELQKQNRDTLGIPYKSLVIDYIKKNCCYIMEIDGISIGTATLFHKTRLKEYWVNLFVIDAKYRNMGYGTLFLDYLLSNIPKKNSINGVVSEPCYTACVMGAVNNKLYNKFGYVFQEQPHADFTILIYKLNEGRWSNVNAVTNS